ncbi:3'-5' exonuclease [Allonocardiopsis opalescens]|uniref:3'-5' exonuclease n=1 Tax=Allonocardiopsis opalescens TaxID=1144618 RepID=UPI001475DA1F|nr:3'-5' exonuclease [Allonocardiopsis opalescens]
MADLAKFFAPGCLGRTVPGPDSRSLTFAALDVETTGLDPAASRVCEVAVVRFRGDGEVLSEYATLVDPQAPMAGTELHEITAEHVTGAPSFAEVLPEVHRLLTGAVVVAHNLAFEDAFFAAEAERAGWSGPAPAAVCTLVTARAQLAGRSYKLNSLYKTLLGSWFPDAHTALGDCRALARLVPALLEQAPVPLRYEGPDPLPGLPRTVEPVRLQPRAVHLSARRGWLAGLAASFPRTADAYPVEPEAERGYRDTLSAAVTRGRLTGEDARRLAVLAGRAGFTQQRLVGLHHAAWAALSAAEDARALPANRLADLAAHLGVSDDAARTDSAAAVRVPPPTADPDAAPTHPAGPEAPATGGGADVRSPRPEESPAGSEAAAPGTDRPESEGAAPAAANGAPTATGGARRGSGRSAAEREAMFRHTWRAQEREPHWPSWDRPGERSAAVRAPEQPGRAAPVPAAAAAEQPTLWDE